MNWRHTPHAQIALICLRSLNIHDSRWLYFTLTCFAVLGVVGGGFAVEWEAKALAKAAFAAIAFSLQFAWIWISAVLLKLNQPNASRLVPGYVQPLRHTTVVVWLGICLLTGVSGMLNGFSIGFFIFQLIGAGAFMLWLSTPMRWPVQWLLSMVALWWFARNVNEIFQWNPLLDLLKNKVLSTAFAAVTFLAMAWIVTRLIADRGTAYASRFSGFLGMQSSDQVDHKRLSLKLKPSGRWLNHYQRIGHWLTFIWRHYANHLLATPLTGPQNTFSRAMLGFGAGMHWITQISLTAFLGTAVSLGWLSYNTLFAEGWGNLSPLVTFNVAMFGAICGVYSVLLIPSALLITSGEQKLMLMLPGMPRGTLLNRLLAQRHLRLGFSAWGIAAAWLLLLPFPDKAGNYLQASLWGTLPLIPLVVHNWAALRPPTEVRMLLWFGLAAAGPVAAGLALIWLHVPLVVVAAFSIMICIMFLYIRWRNLTLFAQAFPAGQHLHATPT